MNDENLKKGKKFSKDYQPTPQAKSEGKQRARSARESMIALAGGRVKDDALASRVMEVVPDMKREEVTQMDVVNQRQLFEAMNGNTRAYANVMRTMGEWEDKHVFEGEGLVLNIQSSDTGAKNIARIMEEG